MLGDRSFQLFRVFGIRIGASPSWFIVLFLMLWWLSSYFGDVLVDETNTVVFGTALAATFLFFLSLLLHELGHALVARRLGIGTAGIDLWLFGGVAKLTRDSQTPGEEFKVAAAGPLVTAVIVGVCIGIGALASRMTGVVDTATFQTVATTPFVALIGWLALVNLVLLLFNLIPAFPLDGGRIARSAAWAITGDRGRGTRFSARLGEVFSWLMIGFGIVILLRGDVVSGLWFAILGWFLGQAARGAVASSRFTERLEGVTAADVMDAQPVSLPAATPVLAAHEDWFLRYRWPWFPVVDELGRLRGILREEDVQRALADGRPALAVGELLGPRGPEDAVLRDTPVEAMLGIEPIRSLGAVMVVDADERLCGVVTAEQLRRALAAAAAPQR
jgi:Zn-dependent protease/CBS domain-containing protein